MPDTISPVTREEDYLAAIAGQDVTPPTPVTRKEEWLDLIAGKVDDLAGDIKDLQDIVPTPAAGDSGKVLTAEADGTASWQTASGGGGGVIHVGARALDSMAVAPDGSEAATVYDKGYYSGGVTYNGNVVQANFYFEYSDSDITGLPLVNSADYGEGFSENSSLSYLRHTTAQSLTPATEDPSGTYYMLTPANTVTYTVMPFESGVVQVLAAVLPANTPFMWVKHSS